MELCLPWAQNKQTYQEIKEYRKLNDIDLATPPHPTHTHMNILRHTSALLKMESCKIMISEGIYPNLARAKLRNGCLDPTKISEISETSKQRQWRARGDLLSLSEITLVELWQSPRTPDFKAQGQGSVVKWHGWAGTCIPLWQSAGRFRQSVQANVWNGWYFFDSLCKSDCREWQHIVIRNSTWNISNFKKFKNGNKKGKVFWDFHNQNIMNFFFQMS